MWPMRLALSLMLLLIAAAPAAAAVPAPPPAKVRTVSCLTGLDARERAARFEADLRAVPGTVRMQVRFTLMARTAGRPEWTAVDAPGFGTWSTSVAGVARYVYTKTVQNLLAPARYRTVVQFLWRGADGKTILRARRASRTCRQPDLRPDLVLEDAVPTESGYAVTIANEGRTDAASFLVTLQVGARTYELGRVARLARGQRIRITGQTPRCGPGETVTVRVDAGSAVDERDEDGNVLAAPCAR